MRSVVYLALLVLIGATAPARATSLFCSTVTELEDALQSVQPGDEIVLASGTVFASPSVYASAAHFTSNVDGTAAAPITLRSEDDANPATLKGADPKFLTVLRLFGDYWTVRDLIVTNAQKGIIFDNAHHGNVFDCTVHGIGYEGIHWRDGSDYGLIDGCHIYDTGLEDPGFGEGVYIGTDNKSWSKYDPYVSHVTVRNCVFGPQIAAEALDIKEGTSDIVVEYNTFDATGVSQDNFADSFIDLKGTRAIVRYNTFHQNSEPNLRRGVAVIDRSVDLSSYEHAIHDNVFVMESVNLKMVEAYSGASDVYAWNNVREPSNGDTYSSSVIDECCPPWYMPGDGGGSTCPTPTGLVVGQVTNTSATLSWSAVDSATSYTLLLQDDSTTSTMTDTTGESYSFQDLELDTVYMVQVQAICENDEESSFSTPPAFFRTLDNDDVAEDAPTRPTNAQVIYDDALASGWNEYSFSGSYDLTYSTQVREGLYSIEAACNGYGGLQFKHDGLQASDFEYIFFWIKAADSTYGTNSPNVELTVNSMEYEFQLESSAWQWMLVPISESSITKVVLQNRSSNSRTVLVDSVELWPAVPNDPPSSSDAPSSAPVEAPTTASSIPTLSPSAIPTVSRTGAPLASPSESPSFRPTQNIPPSPHPSSHPTAAPAPQPTRAPALPTDQPSARPTSKAPTFLPTVNPTFEPSAAPVVATNAPTTAPMMSHAGVVVFRDYLDSEWSDYSYKGTIDFDNTSPIAEGTKSIHASLNKWGALHMKDNTGLDSTGLTSLAFWIQAANGAVGDDKVRVKINGKKWNLTLNAVGTWQYVVVSLAEFSNPSTIDSVTIQNASGSSRDLYLDQIEFLFA